MSTGGDPSREAEPASGASGGTGGETVRRRVTIVNSRGLHARAAAKFAKTVGAYDAQVTVSKGEQTVSGLSIMGLMMLAATPGSDVDLIADGPDARAVIKALEALIAARFDEDDAAEKT
ncbi:MAG: HPr family phosphocarrier protein [Rhodospirillaceae bacterium]|jgi:phosphocarrier protein|nr:HPr family phosphocarrier protein [Rhodospirillaceae bacterium]|tara:strand:+ start:3824 stop:4180 length:357 start_codon:yes stop_codon:yes gene_type:complete